MTADARSLPLEVGDTFDFDSQAGILFVLRAIRAAAISSEEKNKLKDLVFLYSTGGKDEAVKKKLADTLASVAITPATVLLEVPKVIETPALTVNSPVVPGFMGGRPTPVFNAPVATASPAVPATPVAPVTNTVPVPETAPVSVTPHVEEAVAPVTVATPEPVVVNTASVKDEVSPVEKIIPVAPPVRPIVPVPQSVAEAVAPSAPEANTGEVTKVVETPTQTNEPSPYVVDRMERIRVIKSDINARVGNPVNLGEIDDGLRREYMTALLEAMKLLSTASEQESSIAMTRLEAVYAKAVSMLDAQTKVVETPVAQPVVSEVMAKVPEVTPVQPIVAPVVAKVVTPVAIPVMQSVADVVAARVQASTPAPTPTPAPTTAPVPAQTPVPVVVAPVSEFIARSKVSERPVPTRSSGTWDTETTPAPLDVPIARKLVVQADEPLGSADMRPEVAEVVHSVTPVYTPEVTQAVSEVQPLRAITELPTADQVSEIEAMGSNPLYTKDVDAGLDQLLGEWAIFKKSGMFGTGPKGREHPLYIKIAPLQVPLILSGRFEGSTQEIKQSITDYMNGWRYEQGIIYEANETFDQYLRRVIRHILDLQKSKRRS